MVFTARLKGIQQMIRHETTRFKLEEHRTPFSFTLTRKSDGFNCFFQSDDADIWDSNMTALEKITGWNAGNSLDKSFDFLCDGYADVLGPFELKAPRGWDVAHA